MATIDKHSYAHMFDSTVAELECVRLADTGLWMEVEKDLTGILCSKKRGER